MINNIDRVNTSIDFTISDGSDNIGSETIYFTLLFNENDLVSNDTYNFPNPFNNVANTGTTIRYMLTSSSNSGNFIVLDASGRTVLRRGLGPNELSMGTHYIQWNGNDASDRKLSSGIYFGFLEFEGKVEKRLKMVIHNK